MIKRRPELDTVNPPGQIVNRPAHMEKPLQEHIEDFVMDTEEMFATYGRCKKFGSLPCGPKCCLESSNTSG